jgi:hypothetical protein
LWYSNASAQEALVEELDNELDAQGRELSIAEARLAEMRATIVGLRWREATWTAQKRRMLGGDGGGGGGNMATNEDGMVAGGESIRRDGVSIERDDAANSAGSVAVTVEDIAAGELSVQSVVTGEVIIVPLPPGIAAGDQMDVPSALLTGGGDGTSGGSSAQQQQQAVVVVTERDVDAGHVKLRGPTGETVEVLLPAGVSIGQRIAVPRPVGPSGNRNSSTAAGGGGGGGARDQQEDAAMTMQAAFAAIDEDGSGSLDRSEVRRLLGMLGQEINDEKLEEVMATLDTDGDGTVDFTEFERHWSSESNDGTPLLGAISVEETQRMYASVIKTLQEEKKDLQQQLTNEKRATMAAKWQHVKLQRLLDSKFPTPKEASEAFAKATGADGTADPEPEPETDGQGGGRGGGGGGRGSGRGGGRGGRGGAPGAPQPPGGRGPPPPPGARGGPPPPPPPGGRGPPGAPRAGGGGNAAVFIKRTGGPGYKPRVNMMKFNAPKLAPRVLGGSVWTEMDYPVVNYDPELLETRFKKKVVDKNKKAKKPKPEKITFIDPKRNQQIGAETSFSVYHFLM